jgi:hypothetical protein
MSVPLKAFEQKLKLWKMTNKSIPPEQLAVLVTHFQKGLRQTRMEQWILDNEQQATSDTGLEQLLVHCKLEEPDDPYLLKDALARVTSMKRTDGERHLEFVDRFERALRDLVPLGVNLVTPELESLRVVWLIDKIGVDPQTCRYLLAEAGTPPDYQKVVKSLRRQYHSTSVSTKRKDARWTATEEHDTAPVPLEPESKSFEQVFVGKSTSQIEALLTKKGLKLARKAPSNDRASHICKVCKGKGHFDTERKCPKHPDHDPNYIPPWRKNKDGKKKSGTVAECATTTSTGFDWTLTQDFRLGRTEAPRS